MSHERKTCRSWKRGWPRLALVFAWSLALFPACGGTAGVGSGPSFTEPPAVPAEVAASDGTHEDLVEVTWAPAERAVSYRVYLAIDDVAGEYRLLAEIAEATTYQDTEVSVGRAYFYRVTAVNDRGESAPSAPDLGFAGPALVDPPEAPTDLEATDGVPAAITVTWAAAAAAASYTLYRAPAAAGPFVVLAADLTASIYSDADVVVDRRYHYRVTAVNSAGESAPSAPDEGYASAAPPEAPQEMTASDGAFRSKVQINWAAVAGADTYTVYRGDDAAGPFAALAADVAETWYEDDSVVADVVYHYQVTATGAGGEGPPSDVDAGHAATGAPEPPDTPTDLQASTDLPLRIELDWPPAARADWYTVLRADSEAATATELATALTDPAYVDEAVNAEEDYFYRVVAGNADGTSSPSEAVRGYALRAPPAIPQDVVATDGEYGSRVLISWSAVAGAASYKVYRGDLDTGPFDELASGIPGTEYADQTAPLGAYFYYAVSAVNTTAESDLSQADGGFADLQAPTGLAASAGAGHWDIDLTWNPVEGTETYNVYLKVNLGGWNRIASGVVGCEYTVAFSYLASLQMRVSAVSGSYEGPQSQSVSRWTAY